MPGVGLGLHGIGGGQIFSSCILIMHLFLTVASFLTTYFFQPIILSNFLASTLQGALI